MYIFNDKIFFADIDFLFYLKITKSNLKHVEYRRVLIQ